MTWKIEIEHINCPELVYPSHTINSGWTKGYCALSGGKNKCEKEACPLLVIRPPKETLHLTSGKLQDIDANIKLLSEQGTIGNLFHRLACPWMMFTPKEKWLGILQFERKQESDRLRFIQQLKREAECSL